MKEPLHILPSDNAYLIDLAHRLRNVPVIYGVDQFDIDCLADIAGRLAKPDAETVPIHRMQEFEQAFPDVYWHVAKGKITEIEPMYGAILMKDEHEIGQGESDISAAAAFNMAFRESGLVWPNDTLPSDSYQDRVAAAHGPLFDGDPTDIAERRNRNFEESTETAQAFGMTREEAIALVEYTFSRPVGDKTKELGSQILTAFSLAVVADIDAMAAAEADLENLQRPETIARIRAKRLTRHGRGPLPGVDEGWYCTDCEAKTAPINGRCPCGSGRVMRGMP